MREESRRGRCKFINALINATSQASTVENCAVGNGRPTEHDDRACVRALVAEAGLLTATSMQPLRSGAADVLKATGQTGIAPSI